MTDIMTPSLGESVTEATVARWAKGSGETVARDELVVELETDKVLLEVLAPSAGVLEINARMGETVLPGALLGRVVAGPVNAMAADVPAPSPETTASGLTSRVEAVPNEPAPALTKAASPAAPPLTKAVSPAAPVSTKASPAPSLPSYAAASASSGAGRETRVRMTRLRQTIAKRLKQAQNTAAMLTTFNEVDMSAVLALRSRYKDVFEKHHGVKLGFMSFFVRACVAALKAVPDVNAQIDGADLVYKNHYDIGVAVGTDRGLVVPVLRDADKMSLAAIEAAVASLGRKAREGSLAIDELQGGTFTISNGGVYGSLVSTPILNAPQSGILGMHKIQDRTMVIAGEVTVRPMMYVALSYDHRVIDGRGAVTFLVKVKEHIEDPQRGLLDL
jgi:2-oxoglutarate dehydrogenase E2 component (dihydrolipoamide succinyltransferase)